jgi:hypothetical protein
MTECGKKRAEWVVEDLGADMRYRVSGAAYSPIQSSIKAAVQEKLFDP